MDPVEHGQCSIRKNFLREIVIFLKISWFLGFHFTILLHACLRQKNKTGANTKSLSSPGSSWCSSQSSVVELVIDRLMIVTGQQCQECEEGHEG